MSRLVLYYRAEPERDRWLRGDRFLRPVLRNLVRGSSRPSGLDKVFANLCRGLEVVGVPFSTNLPYSQIRDSDIVGVLGRGKSALVGYDRSNPIVAGIGLMTHPSEWPTLLEEYPVVRYLQHSDWANEIYKPYFGDRCRVWPVGIDTEAWTPEAHAKDVDFLVYDKIQWNRPLQQTALLDRVRDELKSRGLKIAELRYGSYSEHEFRACLARSKAMIFLTEHESQGLAYQECLSCGVPVLAWNQGKWLDPNRFRWGSPDVRASSVPYFDPRCGETFAAPEEFAPALELFQRRLHFGELDPRTYILENLGLEDCARRFVEIVEGAVS
jgi:hypothetical protein